MLPQSKERSKSHRRVGNDKHHKHPRTIGLINARSAIMLPRSIQNRVYCQQKSSGNHGGSDTFLIEFRVQGPKPIAANVVTSSPLVLDQRPNVQTSILIALYVATYPVGNQF